MTKETATCPTTLSSLGTIIEHLIAENMALRKQLDESLKLALTAAQAKPAKKRRLPARPAANQG